MRQSSRGAIVRGGFPVEWPFFTDDRGVTSIERVLGRPVPMAEAEDAVIDGMRQVFET